MKNFVMYDGTTGSNKLYYLGFLVVIILVGYGFASLAIDTANWLYYGLAILCVYIFVAGLVSLIKNIMTKEKTLTRKKNVKA